MNYSTIYTVKENYLFVCPSGKQTTAKHKVLAQEIQEKMKSESKTNVMIDIRNFYGESPGIVADHAFSKFLAPLVFDVALKIAIIYLEKEEHYLRFFETSSRNQGINLKVFTDVTKAEEWIST